LELRGHVMPPALRCIGRWKMEPPPELPQAGRRALVPRGHVAPPDPPQAQRWVLEPWGHMALPELPRVGRWAPEPR
jgi:hypothetical protein